MAEQEEKPTEDILSKADELYDEDKIDELYELLLPHATGDNADTLWRLGRAEYSLGQQAKDGSDQKKKYMMEAYAHVKKALELDDQNYAVHKWYGILLDIAGGYEGTKKRIENSFTVKEHFQKAIDLNPKDPTSYHTLGVWHYELAALPWYQKKIAAVIFAKPPETTFKEALELLMKAEEITPNFYCGNLLMIGKCYLKMGEKAKAKEWLTKAEAYDIKSIHDKKAASEAKSLL